MKLLEVTLAAPEENIALDEAILEEAEAGGGCAPVLRLWESPVYAVVVGRSSRVQDEVAVAVCREERIPIIRRTSGGAAVAIGPGCLMYAVVLPFAERPEMRMIEQAHCRVLGVMAQALSQVSSDVSCSGTSDLTLRGKVKFSGNSLRCKRDHLLYHGTILYNFDLPLVGRLLKSPPRQPEYRAGREHGEFVANLPASGKAIRAAVITAWGAATPLVEWPESRTRQLAESRFRRQEWTFQR